MIKCDPVDLRFKIINNSEQNLLYAPIDSFSFSRIKDKNVYFYTPERLVKAGDTGIYPKMGDWDSREDKQVLHFVFITEPDFNRYSLDSIIANHKFFTKSITLQSVVKNNWQLVVE